jgi:hypothetical protein
MLAMEGFALGNTDHLVSLLEPLLCVVGLLLILRAKQFGPYRFLAALLATRLAAIALLEPLLFYSRAWHFSPHLAYELYFYIYWASDAIEALLGFGIILSIYRLAMSPLKGLEKLGMIMFRWAAAISVALAITIGFGPHITSMSFIMRAVSQLQQTQSVLTLCMLLFVCFAIHPMGLSYRSRIFGVSLGIGLLATTDLVTAAWIAHSPSIYGVASSASSIAICVTLTVWAVYFAIPEPKRRMIVLPTTSPFFRWNQISLVLGDAPGFVAIGEVTTDMFAPAELEVMRRASGKMNTAAAGY